MCIFGKLAFAAVAGVIGATAAEAADMSAETAAFLADVLAPYHSGAAPTAGVDPAAFKGALDALDKEKLLGLGRPPTGEAGIVESYGKALGLGTRAPQFLPEIAAIRDAVLRGDDAALRAAIGAVSVKAGRKPPEDDILKQIVTAVRGAEGSAPSDSERHSIARPDYTIDIENLRGAGAMRVDVTRAGPDGAPTRTSFTGEAATRTAPNGQTLERRVVPDAAPRTITSAEAARLAAGIAGRWIDQRGDPWDLAIAGGSVAATHHRRGKTELSYAGTYALGRIEAAHRLVAPDDMEGDLPGDVRDQIIARGLSFRIHLDVAPEPDKLAGTWSSQHVTYSGLDHAIQSIHDPFDEKLVLIRESKKIAQGGLAPRDGP